MSGLLEMVVRIGSDGPYRWIVAEYVTGQATAPWTGQQMDVQNMAHSSYCSSCRQAVRVLYQYH